MLGPNEIKTVTEGAAYYAIHFGKLHSFDKYTEISTRDCAHYEAQDGRTYGVSPTLIGTSRAEAFSKFVSEQKRMVDCSLKTARQAIAQAELWANNLSRFALEWNG